MPEIIVEAFECVADKFELTVFQRNLLYQIIVDNLDRINFGNFDLIKNNIPRSEARNDGLLQLENQVKRFKVNRLELLEIPHIHTIILTYLAVAHLSVDV